MPETLKEMNPKTAAMAEATTIPRGAQIQKELIS
jgi:hypothetical protein